MDMREVLFKETLEGNVSSMLELLREDPSILDRETILNPYNQTPLHVASKLGHLGFVKEILIQKPELAQELNSHGSSPLHLASAEGYAEIVKELILVFPDMCNARDGDGLNPLHIAAMKGRVDVLRELLGVRVHAARAIVRRGETILHLCVKHNRLEALKLLVKILSDHEFLNSKDDAGHSILHLASAYKQIETIKFLLLNTSIEVNERNADGLTAMSVLAQSRGDCNEIEKENFGTSGLEESRNKSLSAYSHSVYFPTRDDNYFNTKYPVDRKKHLGKFHKKKKWLDKTRNTLMVVASLIATMAFQIGVNPPSGVWQDSKDGHTAGFSIMASNYPDEYSYFLMSNTTSFIASLSIVLLLISGLPFRRRIFMWILMVIMWVAVTATSLTFLISMISVTPYYGSIRTIESQLIVKFAVLMVWIGLLGILILIHIIRVLVKSTRKLNKIAFQKRRVSSSVINHDIV